MKNFLKKNKIVFAAICYAFALGGGIVTVAFLMSRTQPVQAQGGFVSIGTYSQQVIVNAVTLGATHVTPVTGTSPTGNGGSLVAIGNSGQSSHWLMYCVTAGTLTLQLEGSGDSNTWTQISEQGQLTAAGCGVLEAAGYYNYIRVNILAMNASAGVANAWYSATGNAIPGSGITAGGKTPQPVTFNPSFSFANTNLKSTGQNIGASVTSVFSLNAYNPNASPVFVVLTPALVSPVSSTTLVYGIPASGSRDIVFPKGIEMTGNSTVACATSVTGVGDPATGCVVSLSLTPLGSVASSVSNLGVATATSATVPR
jgi:hypothetical protein